MCNHRVEFHCATLASYMERNNGSTAATGKQVAEKVRALDSLE